jgi:hypothetical protein
MNFVLISCHQTRNKIFSLNGNISNQDEVNELIMLHKRYEVGTVAINILVI